MALQTYELRDPARLMADISEQTALVEDTAHVALVHHPSTTQRLVTVKQLDLPALLDDDDRVSEPLRAVAESFGLGLEVPFGEYLLMTVVVRPGRCILGPNEAVWLNGWRYANHMQRLVTGDLILVTEYGWVDFMTHAAGHEPAMLRRAPAAAVVED